MDKFEAIKFRYDQAFARGSTSTAVQDIGQLLNELNRRQAALDAAEQSAAEAEGYLQLLLGIEFVGNATGIAPYCPWCGDDKFLEHTPDCTRQAAAKWLEEHGK